MENQEISSLITIFKEYRDLLSPIQSNLNEFASSYESVKKDINILSESLENENQKKLLEIFNKLKTSANESDILSRKISEFAKITDSYKIVLDKLLSHFEKLENKLSFLNEIDLKAENQIERINLLIEERKKDYNIKDLQKSLDSYSLNVEKVSEFINKDIAETLSENNKNLINIKTNNEAILQELNKESLSIEKLADQYKNSNILLKTLIENNQINEEYIFDIIDKWSESRNVKIKK